MLAEERQGAPFPGTKRQTLYAMAEKSPLLTRLAKRWPIDRRHWPRVEKRW
jgi:hypothetical protein